MQAPLLAFDIFRGKGPGTESLWIESVEGQEAAVARMHILAAKEPGPYFVFHVLSSRVLASVDTD